MLLARVEDDLVGADRVCGQDRAIKDEVRSVSHQDPILEACRLAFRTVHNDHGPTTSSLRERTPLAPDRESGAAPAKEATRLERVDEFRRLFLAR